METDDVIADLRAVRDAYTARFGFDPAAMARDLREREQAGGRVVVPPPAKPVVSDGEPTPAEPTPAGIGADTLVPGCP